MKIFVSTVVLGLLAGIHGVLAATPTGLCASDSCARTESRSLQDPQRQAQLLQRDPFAPRTQQQWQADEKRLLADQAKRQAEEKKRQAEEEKRQAEEAKRKAEEEKKRLAEEKQQRVKACKERCSNEFFFCYGARNSGFGGRNDTGCGDNNKQCVAGCGT